MIKRVNFASLLLTLVTAAGNVGLGKPRDATDCTVAELTPVTIIAKSESTLRASSGLTLAVGGLTCSGKAGVNIVMIVPIDVVIIGKVVDSVTDIAGPYPAAVKPAAVLADVAVVQAATAAVAAPNIIIADISFP